MFFHVFDNILLSEVAKSGHSTEIILFKYHMAIGCCHIVAIIDHNSLYMYFIIILAFIWPKAGRPHPYRCLCSHAFGVRLGSIWDSPASKAMSHTNRPARDWLVQSVCARLLRNLAFVAHADYLKVDHFALFSQFLHIKGRNFPDVFPFTSACDPYEPWKVSWKLVRMFWEIRKTDRRHTHTDRCGNFIYIYTYI